MKKIIYTLLILFAFIMYPKAECSYKEQTTLNKEAANIKIKYDIKYQELPEGYYSNQDGFFDQNGKRIEDDTLLPGYYFEIRIYNVTENVEIEFDKELYNQSKQLINKVSYTDTVDGNITLLSYNTSERVEYKFEIYSSTNSACGNDLLRNALLTTPKYNEYSSYYVCEGLDEYEMCQPFYQTNLSIDAFSAKIEKYKKSLEKKDDGKGDAKNIFTILLVFFQNYWWIIVIVVAVCVGASIYYFKFRKGVKNANKK